MDLLAPVKAFDRLQQRHAPLAIPVAVIRKFSDDGAGNQATLIAYYAFVSIFPLLLLFTTVLGFVLQDNPKLQEDILNTALSELPVIGEQLRTQSLTGSGMALAVGIVGTLLSGLGVTVAAQNAFAQVYAVPHKRRPDFFMTRVRGLLLLISLGGLQILSTAISGLAAGGFGGKGTVIGGLVLSLAVNATLFLAVFRLLTHSSVPFRELWPGIVVATISWTALQALGGIYVAHVLRGASEAYGTFATVIGLIAWLYLGARVVVYSAEINTVLARRLWPRSLLAPPILDADHRALTALARTEERSDHEVIEVHFRPPPEEGDGKE
jgi:YihY family inner membrane protein